MTHCPFFICSVITVGGNGLNPQISLQCNDSQVIRIVASTLVADLHGDDTHIWAPFCPGLDCRNFLCTKSLGRDDALLKDQITACERKTNCTVDIIRTECIKRYNVELELQTNTQFIQFECTAGMFTCIDMLYFIQCTMTMTE